MENLKLYTHEFFMTAGECTPQKEMPLPLLVSRLIEVATEHANIWGVGYAKLKELNQAWVLSRVTIEMTGYPRVNESYTIRTWVEGYNRYFSQRNFEIVNSNGDTLGYARTIWLVIDSEKREMVDISNLSYVISNIYDKDCPIEPQSRLKPLVEGRVRQHRFLYTDTDINCHVNSVRYVEALLNQWDLEHYDKYMVKRFEIAYVKECYGECGYEVTVNEDEELDAKLEISKLVGDGRYEINCRARIVFENR
ncbi:MAG: acyl-[acyl-carrier-protein] thioesterase [Bacteroidales bacterium]|nr:acyl-[acyl-carrier-protein] thioesterase [Bacteroidales bacterium]